MELFETIQEHFPRRLLPNLGHRCIVRVAVYVLVSGLGTIQGRTSRIWYEPKTNLVQMHHGISGGGLQLKIGDKCFHSRSSILAQYTIYIDTCSVWAGVIRWLLVCLRVTVVMEDKSRTEPHFLAPWHVFLPSEVQPRCINLCQKIWSDMCIIHACELEVRPHICLRPPSFRSTISWRTWGFLSC